MAGYLIGSDDSVSPIDPTSHSKEASLQITLGPARETNVGGDGNLVELGVMNAPAAGPAPPARLFKHASQTMALNSLTLAVTLVSGVLIARVLGTVGRGELTAVLMAPQLLAWLFAMGCLQAIAYHHARFPRDGPRLLTTWLLILVPLSLLGVATGELVLPHMLAAQSSHTLHLAQLFIWTVIPNIFGELFFGIVLGEEDFLFFNLMRLAQPVGVTIAYAGLWRSGSFTLESALATVAVSCVAVNAIGAARVLARHRLAAPSWALARRTLWYGIKAHGTKISDLVTLRLDLAFIPAFLAASSVGLYAVAVAVAGVVGSVAESLSFLVLPIAARRGERGTGVVIQLLKATVLIGAVLAAALACFSTVAIAWIFGPSFADSAPIVWFLLPGVVLYAGAAILRQALYAANRPFTAAMTFAVGPLITVPGLILFVPAGGIAAAAIVSTVSYGAVAVAALIAYRQVTHLSLRDFISSSPRATGELPGVGDSFPWTRLRRMFAEGEE
jgi:O-antigen/teichoic acid export membrane protein